MNTLNVSIVSHVPPPRIESMQPVFLDCQQELLHGFTDRERLVRLRSWLLVSVIVALGGWVTVAVMLIMI